jgi:hypothetical protein
MVKDKDVKCEKCGFSDIRALHEHHILDESGRRTGAILWLCANCHAILHDQKRKGTLEPEYRWLEEGAKIYFEWLVERHSYERLYLVRSCVMAFRVLASRFRELGGRVELEFHSEEPAINNILEEARIEKRIDPTEELYFHYRALSLLIDLFITLGIRVAGRVGGGGGFRRLGE